MTRSTMTRSPLTIALLAGTTLGLTTVAGADVSHWICADGDYSNTSCWDDGIPTDAGEGGSIDFDNFGVPYTVNFEGSVTVATMTLAHPDARWYMEDSQFNPAFNFTVGQGSLMTAVDSDFVGQTGIYTNNGTSVFQGDCFVDLQDLIQNDLLIVKGSFFHPTTTFQNGFTNNALLSIDATSQATWAARMEVLTGVLTNTGIIQLNSPVTFDEASLSANIDNLGAIVVYKEASLDKVGATYNNSSVIDVRQNAVLTISDAGVLRNTGDVNLFFDNAKVHLAESFMDNTGGNINLNATNTEFVLETGSILRGGAINTAGGTQLRVGTDGSPPFTKAIEDLTINGALNTGINTGSFIVRGTIDATNGAIFMPAQFGGVSVLQLDSDATILGGELSTSIDANSLRNRIEAVPGFEGVTLTLDGTTVRGICRLGNDTLGIVNRGTVRANAPIQRLIIDPHDTAGFDNTMGVIEAASGATLELADGPYDNTGSSITAEDGGLIEFTAGDITGGTLRAIGTGLNRLVRLRNMGLRDVAIEGCFEALDNVRIRIVGQIDNTLGVINLLSPISVAFTDVALLENTTISGGQIVMSDSSGNRFLSHDGGNYLLTLDGVDVTGAGRFGTGNIGVVSSGPLTFDGAEESFINVDSTLGFLSTGPVLVTAGSSLDAESGPMTVKAPFTVEPGALFAKQNGPLTVEGVVFDMDGTFGNIAETTIRNGEFQVSGSVIAGDVVAENSVITVEGGSIDSLVTLNNSVLRGEGFVSLQLAAPGARIEPGLGIGTLNMEFFDLRQDGVLAIEIGGTVPGTEHDQLLLGNDIVTGQTFLDGQSTVEVTLVGGFTPQVGQSFSIIDTGHPTQTSRIFGEFGTLAAPDISPLAWSLFYRQISTQIGPLTVAVELRVVCPADFNGDGQTNTGDVLAFLNAFATGDPTADFNGDGLLNTTDLLAFLNAFTVGCA